MSKRFAIIDCGTNTFNLLVAEVEESGKWHPLLRTKIPVKLAPSPTTGKIGLNRFGRGIDAMHIIKNNLINLSVDKAFAFATSAIREAVNGREFIEFVKQQLGMNIRVISGETEAQMIYKGVIQSMTMGEEPHLIMDIGGGSVEFVIAHDTEVFWKKSREIGVSRLKGRFMPKDPMEMEHVHAVETYLREELADLREAVATFKPTKLVGSSGSFDTFIDLIESRYPESYPKPLPRANRIDTEKYYEFSKEIKTTTLRERLAMPGLLPMRADMIVLSFILVDTALEIAGHPELWQTRYALKEGALAHMIEKEFRVE